MRVSVLSFFFALILSTVLSEDSEKDALGHIEATRQGQPVSKPIGMEKRSTDRLDQEHQKKAKQKQISDMFDGFYSNEVMSIFA
mmetsp:Transcript_38244/g.48734  ORF Transcript_38244/g.48734 Transcript_38244/m.48734 type:complete len:84 (+) Transcript_38244:67-318(+)